MKTNALNRDSLNRDSSERLDVLTVPFNDSTTQQADDSTEQAGDDSPRAWQPFTPRGLAAFANASFGRLFLLLCSVALISAGSVVWFLNTAWYPAIRAAIHELPPQGKITQQVLHTSRTSSTPLAEHHFLGFVVLVPPVTDVDLNSHIVVKFRVRAVDICSIFGYCRIPYPRGWIIDFNRTDLEPGWGAWEPIVTALGAATTFSGLLIIWFALGFIYSFVPWLFAWLTKRKLPWIGSWRICTAGLIPGGLLFVGAIFLYGLGVLDLLQFLVLFVLHFLLAWLCVGLAVRTIPTASRPTTTGLNPFGGPPANIFSPQPKEG